MPSSLLKSFCWLLLPLTSATLAGCGANSQAETPKAEAPLTLPTTQLTARDTILTHDYVADIQAVQNVEIRARLEGFLEQIYVDEGQAVRKGQPLFRINDTEYKSRLSRAQAALSSAQAAARVARLELERVQLLTSKDIISKTELEVAQAKYHAAQADIQQARSTAANAALMLSYTTVKAPFDGVINRIPLKMGSVIEDGTLLTTVSDINDVFAYFNVSEAEYLEYAKKSKRDSARRTNVAHLLLADGSTYSVKGKVETVESQFQANTGSIAFRARFDNPQGLLRHGASGKVRLSNTVEDAVLVPQKSVFEIQDKNYVFMVDKQGRVKQHAFQPQTRLSDFYVVKSGLKSGDNIVYEGVQDLRDGATIRPQPVAMDELIEDAR
ncbi:efflux RND transporter periplasmic adaptor subunit [Hymenobacter endophyticus]|uniref:Efflux RND transporter periplasmic adaptor subunit n=1 Tax=Hymenobacter endophyticus TaxID=3076335 RepID=A0ABU3TN87_9BACT|nr:efflux RND transporter periplasmic adaptor subunit [Hymenobacter endophyticus]MDU0372829.1 efflux RND transporter periplasmic adaptor subunit [Hymenobacter endophyticus]